MAVCRAIGASGLSTFDYTMPEVESITEGRDMMQWRQTLLLYSSSMNPNQKAFRSLYPYHDRGAEEVSKEGQEMATNILKSKIEGRNER